MFKVLVIGSGQLALNWLLYSNRRTKSYILSRSENSHFKTHNFIVKSKITQLELKEVLNDVKPNFVLNAAGFTSVETCERNPHIAMETNYKLPRNLVDTCNKFDIPLIQISTDQFASKKTEIRDEKMAGEALNIYGQTKLDAEKYIIEKSCKYIIIRTNFFGWGDPDHKSTTQKTLEILQRGKQFYAFEDVEFNPLHTKILIEMIEKLIEINFSGIINLGSEEKLSKYEFYKKISKVFQFDEKLIKKAISSDHLEVKRPNIMSLDISLAKKILPDSEFSIDSSIKDFYKFRS